MALHWDDAQTAFIDDELSRISTPEARVTKMFIANTLVTFKPHYSQLVQYMIYCSLVYEVLYFPKSMGTKGVYAIDSCLTC